ncbi:glycosyltransferase family 2 protein [Microbacterium sp. Leaf203]|uniref:glycosyltransferase family 2 protein n=1 Tax=Microbacterium sp. Leaf203 TaxID=1735677 RepID=UPI0006F51093|nr:glycosyltransferase family 2 protein [Microbacterium sp. Leaf203]KQM40140.1 hypothetical protein ASE56_07190 [Microbacterium sp. Leaf203]
MSSDLNSPELSVVIPSYNSAPWLPSTLDTLRTAIDRAAISAEVIVVDDGSTDDTVEVLRGWHDDTVAPVRVLSQPNTGRFAARRVGLEASSASIVMLLDSRVLIDANSLVRIWAEAQQGVRVWNAHIETDPDAPLVGRFWDVPTRLFWGDYLRRPRAMTLTSENFDTAPKGTTLLLAPRDVLSEAFRQAAPTVASPLVSDDTKILRWVAENHGIQIDPRFTAVYRPRTTVTGFLRHARDRGTLFVDSYAGTTPARSAILVGLAAAPPAVFALLVALVMKRKAPCALAVVAAGGLAAAAPAIVAAAQRAPRRAVLAYLTYIVPFAGPFWAGIVRGIVVHRSAFSPSSKEPTP